MATEGAIAPRVPRDGIEPGRASADSGQPRGPELPAPRPTPALALGGVERLMQLQNSADQIEAESGRHQMKNLEQRREVAKAEQRSAVAEAQRQQQEAQGWGFWGQVCKWVAIGLAAVIGAVGAYFTGGASLAIAAVIITGLTTMDKVAQGLKDSGALPKEVADAISFACGNIEAGGGLVGQALGETEAAHWIRAAMGDPHGYAQVLKDRGLLNEEQAMVVEQALRVAHEIAKAIVQIAVTSGSGAAEKAIEQTATAAGTQVATKVAAEGSGVAARLTGAAAEKAAAYAAAQSAAAAAKLTGAGVQVAASAASATITVEQASAEKAGAHARADARQAENRATAASMQQDAVLEQLKDLAEREDRVWQLAIQMGGTQHATAMTAVRG